VSGAVPLPAAAAAPRSAPRGRIRVAALVDYYLPGYKAGGALRTVANMAVQLADEIDFRVVTRDRDYTETEPYPTASAGRWTEVGGTPVRYLSPRERTPWEMGRVLREAAPEVLYLNSLLSPPFTLLPVALRLLGRIGTVPVVLAPRGELFPGALGRKRAKKLAFLHTARTTGLFRRVLWQASSDAEADAVRAWFGADARVLVAPDLREPPPAPRPPAPKRRGELRVAFLSRITPGKNLAGALEAVERLPGEVRLTIYGPVDDPGYWEACRARIARLPSNVRAEHAGPLRREEVPGALARHHLFLLPTVGENFGHAILEALLAGLPVLTSDRTPWGGLEDAGAGWALPLEAPEAFRVVLREYVDADGAEHARRSAAARAYGEAVATDPAVAEANRELFRRALRGV
jgi:glycosyltransferase involved in cell wall biosynthesis